MTTFGFVLDKPVLYFDDSDWFCANCHAPANQKIFSVPRTHIMRENTSLIYQCKYCFSEADRWMSKYYRTHIEELE